MAGIDRSRVDGCLALTSELVYEVRTGKVQLGDRGGILTLGENGGDEYCDAQLDDYHLDYVMRWRPPVQMTLRARFSHPQSELSGTAGFGFWNDPFGMTKIPDRTSWRTYGRLPQAVWFFFASPPSNMAFAQGIAGYGWKAATLDSSGWRAKALLPLAPIAMLLCRWQRGYKMLWPVAQRILKIDEMQIDTKMDEWHTYRLEWQATGARFVIDDREVVYTPYSARGPLGFVAWVDNQYLVATPQGHFRSGVMATETQKLAIDSLEVKQVSLRNRGTETTLK